MLLRPVTFKNTQSVRITRALNNWLAEPNNGQIFAYPILVRMNPHTNVTIVEKYVLQNNFLHPSACSISSTLNAADLQNLTVATNGRMDAYPAYGLLMAKRRKEIPVSERTVILKGLRK